MTDPNLWCIAAYFSLFVIALMQSRSLLWALSALSLWLAAGGLALWLAPGVLSPFSLSILYMPQLYIAPSRPVSLSNRLPSPARTACSNRHCHDFGPLADSPAGLPQLSRRADTAHPAFIVGFVSAPARILAGHADAADGGIPAAPENQPPTGQRIQYQTNTVRPADRYVRPNGLCLFRTVQTALITFSFHIGGKKLFCFQTAFS